MKEEKIMPNPKRHTCIDCGAEIQQPKRGRPRKYCPTCVENRAVEFTAALVERHEEEGALYRDMM